MACRQPSVLSNLCIETIADHMRSDFAIDNLESVSAADDRNCECPFDWMLGEHLTKLFDALCKKRKICESHLPLLLSKKVKVLNLSGCPLLHTKHDRYSYTFRSHYPRKIAENDQLITTVSAAHMNISSLSLQNLEAISCSVLCGLFASLPRLTSLDVSGSKVNDKVVESIATHCQQLEDLNLDLCDISDCGLGFICLPKHYGNKNLIAASLKRLSISLNVNVTVDGVFMVLKLLPQLVYFDHSYWQEVFIAIKASYPPVEENHENCDPVIKTMKRMQALKMNIGLSTQEIQDAIKSGLIKFVCTTCPYLKELFLGYCMYNQVLLNLVSLRHLESLSLGGELDRHHDLYQHGITTVLQEIGSNLKELVLHDIVTDLHLIGKCCPNLKRFFMATLDHDEEIVIQHWSHIVPSTPVFMETEVIELSTEEGGLLQDTCCFEALFGNHNNKLKKAVIKQHPVTISDEQINMCIDQGKFYSLEELILHGKFNLKSIKRLAKSPYSFLQYLELEQHCHQRNERLELDKIVQEIKPRLVLKWV